jgi:hypothetical protein
METDVNLLKFAWKNSWNHIKWTYFVAGFDYLEPLCSVGEQGEKIRNNGLAKISYY